MNEDRSLGAHFEREIREQPHLWRALAASPKAQDVASAIRGHEIVLIGSGSSLFVAELGAIALRSRGIRAYAIPATEAAAERALYQGAIAIACSQSGRSIDVLEAVDTLQPEALIAITNTPDSPLAERATLCIDAACGIELAVPASKSVSVMAAILLWAAALAAGGGVDGARDLAGTAHAVEAWLNGGGVASLREAAGRIARRSSVVVAGSGYGQPAAREFALKIKEASYMHAEGFAAGEFRHGSAAMLDASCAILGILDGRSDGLVRRALREALRAEALAYVVGEETDDFATVGPAISGPFAVLAWLVTGQMTALHLGRARGVQSDAPRGLVKAML